jgi:hypothetical protein
MYVEPVCQLGGASPLHSVTDVKRWPSARAWLPGEVRRNRGIKMRADVEEPDLRHRVSDERAHDRELCMDQRHEWLIRRSRIEDGRTYLGRSAVGLENETGGRAIGPKRAAEVNRGCGSGGSDEGPKGPRNT